MHTRTHTQTVHCSTKFPLYLLLDIVCQCLYVCDMCVYEDIVCVGVFFVFIQTLLVLKEILKPLSSFC